MPSHHAPAGPVGHHPAPVRCVMGMCATLQLAVVPILRALPTVIVCPTTAERTFISAAPQQTTPPPRT